MNYFVVSPCLFNHHEITQIVYELQEYEDVYWRESNYFFAHSVFGMLEPEAKKKKHNKHNIMMRTSIFPYIRICHLFAKNQI